jgi:hypothetical protein
MGRKQSGRSPTGNAWSWWKSNKPLLLGNAQLTAQSGRTQGSGETDLLAQGSPQFYKDSFRFSLVSGDGASTQVSNPLVGGQRYSHVASMPRQTILTLYTVFCRRKSLRTLAVKSLTKLFNQRQKPVVILLGGSLGR